jgi:aconitate hydratase
MVTDSFSSIVKTLRLEKRRVNYYSLPVFHKTYGGKSLASLPYSIRVLLEGLIRNSDGKPESLEQVRAMANWDPKSSDRIIFPFFPGRVLLQDLTGVPIIVDLASFRSAVVRAGGDPAQVNPVIPVDMVIDHSIQVDSAGSPDSLNINMEKEFERNRERYEFLRWAQKSFKGLHIVPPGNGIVHQINLEMLSKGVLSKTDGEKLIVYPDTLVGTDSHTTMANSLGIVGWGVGGIEAVSAMLGHPLEMVMPDVIGFHLTGSLPEGTTPFDLTLTIVQILRKKGVVDKFVEFIGSGIKNLSLADRAMISNMAPEYGATVVYFPVDHQTIDYLRLTGRSPDQIELLEMYFQAQGLFYSEDVRTPVYTDVLELDLGTVLPSVAGPKRPQDRIPLSEVRSGFDKALTAPKSQRGYDLPADKVTDPVEALVDGKPCQLDHGSIVIASITSCTNTSNPSVLIAAGLLAKKAVEKGLSSKPFVKTSFAPGSRVVTQYLEKAGLIAPLDELGFHIVGYGCTTCIGNSGPLKGNLSKVIKDHHLIAAAVISGNRNFEGRVHSSVQANFLASPPLVVAYALTGSVKTDLTTEPLGLDSSGEPVYLKDIWPTSEEIQQTMVKVIHPAMFSTNYAHVYQGNQEWDTIKVSSSLLFPWDEHSTYIHENPFFDKDSEALHSFTGMRTLAFFGDSITTDHISPAGAIAMNSPAGKYLQEHGVSPSEFNTYGARRGNDQVMMRGTFANLQLKNRLTPEVEGGYTLHLPDRKVMSIFDAAMAYQNEQIPLLILAGKEYGTGSSRDWAAKGPKMLGIKAVLAESFERIHRSNLAGMGILPIQYLPGENADTLGLTGLENWSISGLDHEIVPGMMLTLTAADESGIKKGFKAILRLNSQKEVEFIRNGGILRTTMYHMTQPSKK